jgi:CDP-diacylglycerol--glycerol-3-phosphate 3-phosphatidyltransferase
LSALSKDQFGPVILLSGCMGTVPSPRRKENPGCGDYSIHRHAHKQPSMPSIYLLKPNFQAWLRPLARTLAGLGVTANQLTVAACSVSMGFGLILAAHPQSRVLLLLLPILLFLRMALNAMDGMLARECGQKSEIGAYLNELGDVVSDAFLYLPFALLPEYTSRWMVAVIVLAVISEMAGTVAAMTGAGRRYDGPMGKSDRALVFGVVAFWRGLGWSIAPWAAYLFPRLMAALLVTTVINRVRNGLLERNAGGMHG